MIGPAPDSQLMQQGLTHTLNTLPATKARWPVLPTQNFPEPPSPTLITDAALPVTAVTTSEASYSFEPVAHTPWPGLVTEPESEIEPGCRPAQLMVPPSASEVPNAFPLPNGVLHPLKRTVPVRDRRLCACHRRRCSRGARCSDDPRCRRRHRYRECCRGNHDLSHVSPLFELHHLRYVEVALTVPGGPSLPYDGDLPASPRTCGRSAVGRSALPAPLEREDAAVGGHQPVAVPSTVGGHPTIGWLRVQRAQSSRRSRHRRR